MDSNNEHQQIARKLEEIKELTDLQQRKFTEENEKNKKRISTLQTEASSKWTFHRLALQRQRKIEELNAEIKQLKDQVKTKQMLELENKELKEKLDSKKHMEDDYLKLVTDLHMNIRQKEISLEELDESYTELIIRERQCNEELQKARKKLIMGLEETEGRYDNVVVKRMGELDTRPFLKAVSSKKEYRKSELPLRALELCSLWENYLQDPHWYPFKIVTIEGKTQEIIDFDDERLKALKKEVSFDAYNAVVVALKELNEFNPSGRTVVSELWNQTGGV